MKIKIGFSEPNHFKLGACIIKKYLGTDFSHTYVKFKQERLNDNTIFHAVGMGVVYLSETQFKKNNNQVKEFTLELSEDLYNKVLNKCHSLASNKYAFGQNLGLVIKRQFNLNVNPFQDDFNCSELVAYLLVEIWPQDWIGVDLNSVGPDTVYCYLEKKVDGKNCF